MRERYEGSLRETVLGLRTAQRARWRHLLYVRACIDLNSSYAETCEAHSHNGKIAHYFNAHLANNLEVLRERFDVCLGARWRHSLGPGNVLA